MKHEGKTVELCYKHMSKKLLLRKFKFKFLRKEKENDIDIQVEDMLLGYIWKWNSRSMFQFTT